MQQVTISGLANGRKQLPESGAFVAATIGSGSVLDTVEIGDLRLGVGGVVPCGPGAHITAARRGVCLDTNAAYESIRETMSGLDVVIQVADSVELCLWAAGEVPVPCTRRAPAITTVRVPVDQIPVLPFGVSTGLRVIRAGCPGRDRAYLWLTTPDLNPLDTVSVLFRLRRYNAILDPTQVTGARHFNFEDLAGFTVAASTLTADDSSVGPIEIPLLGAEEIEIYLAENTAGDDVWSVGLELVDR